MRFAVLGELEVHDDAGLVVLPSGKLRYLLATLLVNAGVGVDADRLLDVVGGSPAALLTAMTRLRRALGPHRDVIRTLPNGYVVEIGSDQLDLLEFRELLAESHREADPAREAALLRAALDLWRGTPTALAADVVADLAERRLGALERRIELELELGGHADLVTELRVLVAEHPLRERLTGQLMRALHRSNRRAEAVQVYRALCDRLADEQGLDPGPELRALADQLSPPRVVPSELPADVTGFVGRAEEISALEELAGRTAAISGPPGTGKTTLAVHVAHRVRARFPDGQLYVNLRGYSPQPAVRPGYAIARFLRALGVAPEMLPHDEEEQVALYRSLLAERQVLVVLDNAASTEQVLPLLPVAAGCGVLVTSRDTLDDLPARHVALGAFSTTEALGLLDQLVSERFDLASATELVDACAHLPLAIRIAGARIADSDITDYLDELRGESRLTALAIDGDEENAVHTTFSLSYDALSPEVRRLFRLLGVAPGVDFTTGSATVLAGAEAAPLLERLVTANLLQHQDGRFHFHDLLREFARQCCLAEESHWRAATRRLAEWYLAGSENAAVATNTGLHRTRWPEPAGTGREFTDSASARAWVAAELGNLVATATAADAGSISWRLADALRGQLVLAHLQPEWALLADAGLAAARAADDELAQAVMHNSLGALRWTQHRLRDAIVQFTHGADRYRELGPSDGLAAALHNIGIAHMRLGEADLGVELLTESLTVARAAGARLREANALSSLGMACVETGRLIEAERHLRAGLALTRELGNDYTTGNCLTNLCHALREQGRPAAGLELVLEAQRLYHLTGATRGDLVALDELSSVHCALGLHDQALAYGQEGLALARSRADDMFEGRFLNRVGLALRHLGDARGAVAKHTGGLAALTAADDLTGRIESLLGCAEARHELGEDEAAARDAAAALEEIERTGLRLHEQRALAVQRKTGSRDQSRDPVRQ
ncbi:AfsR/SARP family transcriptional regulator [Lentzea tibetensis]|uniref:AfsR/SARP family transcriptional regulator n=1 Tax=Lentzea tibetensis TaxID=2591470 RepID=UPI00164681C2|nr:BTAD domain-containing putative transcriptional regulator [Lentzea tibetensis]